MVEASRSTFVTGGASGIGRAISERLAAEGFAVGIADLQEDLAEEVAAGIRDRGGRAVGVGADVTSDEETVAAVAAVQEAFGPIGVLINNAGYDEFRAFVDTDASFWEKIIDVNYKGVLRTTASILPGMMERRYGRIVNIASEAGRVGAPMEAVYSGAKGAVIAFTKAIARESARSGVTANVICPGPIDTPLFNEIVDAAPDAAKARAHMTGAVPMRRLGQPEELAGAVLFLAGPDASYTTGQTISVSGGLSMG